MSSMQTMPIQNPVLHADYQQLMSLAEESRQNEQQVKQWAALKSTALKQQCDAHDNIIKRGRQTLGKHHEREQDKKAELGKIQENIKVEQKQLQTSKMKLSELRSMQQTVPQLVDERQQELQMAERDAIEAKKLSKETVAAKRYKNDELAKGVEFYAKWLGLDFKRVDDSMIRFTFKQIDPTNPRRKFTFSLGITKSNTYMLQECSPAISRIDEMVDELNKSNDFAAFVRNVRTGFKKLV